MAVAELLALREQIRDEDDGGDDYDPIDRSLAETVRALRNCMRNINKRPKPEEGLFHQLSQALVQRYDNRTDKQARYRPKNPDKKPLGEPTVRKMTAEERRQSKNTEPKLAA